MKKLSKVVLYTIIAALLLVIVILVVYVSANDVGGLRSDVGGLQVEVDYYSNAYDNLDFHYTAAMLEIDNLETIIASKDELILELKITEGVLGLYKDNLEYTLTYAKYTDELLTLNGIPHFDFIGDTVLSDSDWKEIEEQVEHFNYVENGD